MSGEGLEKAVGQQQARSVRGLEPMLYGWDALALPGPQAF